MHSRRVTCYGRKHLFNLFGLSHRTMFLLQTVAGEQKKVALCPVLADAVEPPEGTEITHRFWQHLGKHQREKVLKTRAVQAGKETELQPAPQGEPGKQKSMHRIGSLKGQTEIYRELKGTPWGLSAKMAQNKCRRTHCVRTQGRQYYNSCFILFYLPLNCFLVLL